MKKIRLYFILFLSVAMILTSCKGSTKNDTDQGSVTLTFSTFYDEGLRLDAYKDIVNKFQENHKNIKINLQAQSNGYDDAIKDALGKGKGPDIIGLQRSKMIGYAKQGNLKDISSWVGSEKLKDKYYGVSLGYGSYNEKYYGIGDLPYTVEWYYNEDLFKKAGVEQPKTLDELTEACSKLKKFTSTPISVGVNDPWALNVLFGVAAVQTMDTNELAKAYASGDKNSFSNLKGGDEAVSVMAKLYKSGAINKKSLENTYAASVDDFLKGKAAILPMGSWVSDKIEKSKPKGFNYGVFETPVNLVSNPSSSISATAVQVITLNEKTKHQKEALEFLSYLFSEEAQKIFADKCGISGLKAANQTPSDKVKRAIQNHLDMTDEKSSMYIDNISSKMMDTTAKRLIQMFENKQKSQDIWGLIVNESYAK